MTKEDLINILKPKMLKYLSIDRKEVTLFYINGLFFSNYGLSFINSKGEKDSVCPSEYSLNSIEYNSIIQYLKEVNIQNKCNEIKITIKSNGENIIENIWNKEAFEHSQRIKTIQNEIKKENILDNNKVEFSRFEQINTQSLLNQKICEIPLTEKMISSLFARLFAMFNHSPNIIESGFFQTIKDKETDSIFSLEFNQFGLGYFSNQNTANVKESISIFHSTLLSDLINLQKCKAHITTDFGEIELGYDGIDFFFIESCD
jgi:hypothetical protein